LFIFFRELTHPDSSHRFFTLTMSLIHAKATSGDVGPRLPADFPQASLMTASESGRSLDVGQILLVCADAGSTCSPFGNLMTDNGSYPNGVSMAKIDGEAIRRLREAKGLTQLYVATSVGVTTDTISRWENRRYPTIKKENALKLAEALEVELAAILEKETPEEPTQEETSEPELPAAGAARRSWPLFAALALILIAAGLGGWLFYGNGERPRAEAVRILPLHVPPGQTFPVVIRIVGGKGEASPLILKEELPAGVTPLKGKPAFTGINRSDKLLKWIGKTGDKPVYFAYLARTSPSSATGEVLSFRGQVTLRRGRGATVDILGARSLEIAPYHWADANKDGRIDDEEILTVYENFGDFEGIGFDRELIDSIWAADGYRWDPATGRYEIKH
jgi:transcriptional regulator with XRE-family HTH domain